MADDTVTRNLQSMDELAFKAGDGPDCRGLFAPYHTDNGLAAGHGQQPTHGVEEHIGAMKALVEKAGGTPPQITSHPIGFGSGEWTCVVGAFEGGGRMVTVAEWRHGAVAE